MVHDRNRTAQGHDVTGGGQEYGLCAGTENVRGHSGFQAAVDACQGVDEALQAAQSDS